MPTGYESVDNEGEMDQCIRKIDGEFESCQGELSRN